MSSRKNKNENNYTVNQIDNNIQLLINLTNMSRLKNIKLDKSFSEEFFKRVKHYLSKK